MTEPEVLDLVGIGFGPANLALAIAVEEHNAGRPPAERLRAHFYERQARFGWHRGMLIDDATMQVSFLKDLVTMRNPASDFSFVAFLHERGRLVDFVNHKTLFPLRIEFHDYLEWAASRLGHRVDYGSEVVDVHPVTEADEVVAYDVVVRTDGSATDAATDAGDAADAGPGLVSRRARNVVVALGLEPNVPPGARLGPRVWHNLDLLHRVGTLPAEPAPRRAVVVGAGQSAAEAVDFLHRTFPSAEVCSVFAKYGYTPADDSPFANRIFDPEAVDLYFDAPGEVKRRLFDYHRNTNYSVVDQDLIESLYRRAYQEKVRGAERLRMLNTSQVVEVDERPDGVDVTVEHLPSGARTLLPADVLVYATGYRPRDPVRALGAAGALCRRNDEGLVQVARDYRIRTTADGPAALYLQGGTEHTHGITSTLLSNVAIRAGEIVDAVDGARVARGRPPDSASPVAGRRREDAPVRDGYSVDSPSASRPFTAARAVAARTASS